MKNNSSSLPCFVNSHSLEVKKSHLVRLAPLPPKYYWVKSLQVNHNSPEQAGGSGHGTYINGNSMRDAHVWVKLVIDPSKGICLHQQQQFRVTFFSCLKNKCALLLLWYQLPSKTIHGPRGGGEGGGWGGRIKEQWGMWKVGHCFIQQPFKQNFISTKIKINYISTALSILL